MNITITRGLLSLTACAAAVGFAQDNDPARVYRIGNGVTAPRLIRKVEPQYSEEARKARLAGAVGLRVVIGSDGKARDFRVVRSLGLGLDESSITAVGAWEFEPGLKQGQPVNVEANIEVNFGLLDKSPNLQWHITRAEFHLSDGSKRPSIQNVTDPYFAGGPPGAIATVTFYVDERGQPGNILIEKSSDDGWGRAVTAAIQEWKFNPGSQNGSPVSVSCTMDFVRGN